MTNSNGISARLNEHDRRLDRYETQMDEQENKLSQIPVLSERITNLDKHTAQGFASLDKRMGKLFQILVSLVLALFGAGASLVAAIVMGVL